MFCEEYYQLVYRARSSLFAIIPPVMPSLRHTLFTTAASVGDLIDGLLSNFTE